MIGFAYSSKTQRWIPWINALEAYVGHSMDGDQATDGYSLDFALDVYKSGATVLE